MPPDAPVRPGEILAGKYRVDRVLGVGGMGVVVAATHLQLGQPVALKFMLAEALAQPVLAERFLREARAAVRLRSQHVTRILDVGTLAHGAPYIVMELLDGLDLQQLLQQRGPLPPETAVDFMLQACDALAEAHAVGIVHRDLKPANLFVTVTPGGVALVKVLDFGISKIADPDNVSVTQTAAVFGSPAYMSPEQLRSTKQVDGRSDIWSLGIVLYECVCGHVPFQGESLTEIGLKIVIDPLPPLPRIPGLKPGLDAVIYQCLEKDPAQRPASVAQLAAALAPYASAGARARAASIQGITAPRLGDGGAARVAALTVPPATPARRWPIVAALLLTVGVIAAAAALLGGGGAGGPGTVDARPLPAATIETVDARAAAVAAPPDAAVAAVVTAPPDAPPAATGGLPPAPWSAPPLAASEVPAVFLAQWRKAENRAGCPLLAPTVLGAAEGAKPRAATFYGGWAVAYDKKGLPGTNSGGYDCATCGRSAVGVAGAGVEKDDTMPFPNNIEYADGSRVSHGLVGNSGPGHLAYLTLPDASCLYNVWSAISEENLLELIGGLRRVELPARPKD